MVEDPTTQTGWRINLGPTTMPANVAGEHPTPTFWNERDGWTVGGPAMVHLPGVSLTGLNGVDDLEASLADGSRSLLLDLETGERVAHWVERDVRLGDSEDSVLLLRPAGPLDYGHRYLVAYRDLEDAGGNTLQPTEGFVALRDDTRTGDPDLDQRLDTYNDLVFPALEAEGWSRAEVQIAWDFVTASFDGISRQGLAARDRALAATEDGIAYTVTSVDEAPNESTAFRIKGTFTAPLMTEEDDIEPCSRGQRPALRQRNHRRSFTIVVPNSSWRRPDPALWCSTVTAWAARAKSTRLPRRDGRPIRLDRLRRRLDGHEER